MIYRRKFTGQKQKIGHKNVQKREERQGAGEKRIIGGLKNVVERKKTGNTRNSLCIRAQYHRRTGLDDNDNGENVGLEGKNRRKGGGTSLNQ